MASPTRWTWVWVNTLDTSGVGSGFLRGGSERRITDDFKVIDPGLLWAWGCFDRSQEIHSGGAWWFRVQEGWIWGNKDDAGDTLVTHVNFEALWSMWKLFLLCLISQCLSFFLKIIPSLLLFQTSLVVQMVKRLSTMQETWVRTLGWEDPLEKEMAIHSSTISWKIPWTEEPGRLQSRGWQRVRHNFHFHD